MASIVASLCTKYNANSIKPFLEAAHVFRENFRSSTEFRNLLRTHANLMRGSIGICNRLFDNYESSKQNTIYDWSKHFFNALHAAKRLIDEAYRLAYTVGRDDPTTTTLIETEKNPLVQIQRKVILEDGEYDAYRKTMFDWRCSIQAIYVEEQYMKHLVEMCNARKSKFNPREAKVNTCSMRRNVTITIPDSDFDTTPQICVLNAELITHKHEIEKQEKNKQLSTTDIDNYLVVYERYQRELIAFVFTNFLRLYNETCVQCIKIFLEQQHSIVFNLLQRRKKLIAAAVEEETKQRDEITWTAVDISKIVTPKCTGSGTGDNCTNKTKVVGSLE